MTGLEVEVALEVGSKRTFASGLAWPGWSRAGHDESSALEALRTYAPRYSAVLRGTRLGFPRGSPVLRVVERLPGDATTDFGAPGRAPAADDRPLGDDDLRRFGSILRASWRAFDRAAREAEGRTLEKGPRGGGRDLARIVEHVLGADHGYLRAAGWKAEELELEPTRAAILEALTAAARGEIDPVGPRGGRRWSARYFVRRTAWHVLDHTWEIEDRMP